MTPGPVTYDNRNSTSCIDLCHIPENLVVKLLRETFPPPSEPDLQGIKETICNAQIELPPMTDEEVSRLPF